MADPISAAVALTIAALRPAIDAGWLPDPVAMLKDAVKSRAKEAGQGLVELVLGQSNNAGAIPRDQDLQAASRYALRSALLAMLYALAQQREPRQPLFPALGQFIREGRLWREPLINAMARPDLTQLQTLEAAVKSPDWDKWFDALTFSAEQITACLTHPDGELSALLVPAVERWMTQQLDASQLPSFLDTALKQGWQPTAESPQTITLEQAHRLCLRENFKQRPAVFRSFVDNALGTLRDRADELLDRIGGQHTVLLARLELQAETLQAIAEGQFELKQQQAALLAAILALPPGGVASELASAVRGIAAAFRDLQQQLFGLPLYRFAALPPPPANANLGDLWIIQAKYRSLPLLGREEEMEGLWRWLHDDAPISVRLLVGDAGAGKTRIGYELIWRLAREHGDAWDAGVLLYEDLQQLTTFQASNQWQWQKPTLVLVDYARASDPALRALLRELSARNAQGNSPKFRLLLLERRLTGTSEWLEELGRIAHPGGNPARTLFNPPEPQRLSRLTDLETRRELFAGTLARLNSRLRTPEANQNPAFDTMLGDPAWSDPLLPMMAALVTHQRGDTLAGRDLRRADLGAALARSELRRLLRFANVAEGSDLAELLAAIAGWTVLLGGLPNQELLALARAESERCAQQPIGGIGQWVKALQKAWSDGAETVAGLQPDVVAEAFVVLYLAAPGVADATAEMLIERTRGHEAAVVRLILRAFQDFQNFREVPTAFDVLSSWVQKLATDASARGDAVLLAILDGELPHHSVELAPISAEVTERLLQLVRQSRVGTGTSAESEMALDAYLLDRLATRRAEAGQLSAALAAARDAVHLYGWLASHSRNAYYPALAGSLQNLAAHLGALGQRKEALLVSRDVVRLYRDLEKQQSDEYAPHLAASLTNLARLLSELHRPDQALASAVEAVALFRTLEDQKQGTYTPVLAKALSNLAICQNGTRDLEGALTSAREAVELYRILEAANSDAYMPELARSLANFTNHLSDLGLKQDALAPAQEAVDLSRSLASQNRSAYTPMLASSLSNFALRLYELNLLREALDPAQEAVALRRFLADQSPMRYERDLAQALGVLALIHLGLQDFGAAENAFSEAIRRISTEFLETPAAFGSFVLWLRQQYLHACENTGAEPNAGSLDPLLEPLQSLGLLGAAPESEAD